MSCARFADAIVDHVLGEPAPAELQSHLSGCEACRTALERERELAGRLDGELRQALDVAPSPALLPRGRARVAAEAERRATPWLRFLVPLAAAAATLALVAWLRQPVAPKHPATTARVEPRPAAPATAPPPATVASAKPAPPPPRRREPEVLVPPGEEAALLRFVATLRGGEVDVAALVQPEAPPPAGLAIAPLADLPSLELKPLTAESNPEGVIP